MDFELGGSGTLREPSLGGKINVQSIALNGERLGGFQVEGTTLDRALHIQATSQFSTGELTLQGQIGLHDDLPAQADLHIARLDVDALLSQVLKDNLTGHSSTTGVIHLQGPLRKPELLALRGSLDQLSAGVQGIELSNQGPVEFSVEQKTLRLQQFHFAGNGTELTATGSAELARRHLLRLHAHGDADLALLKVFSPRLESSGTTTFQVDVGGTAANPDMRGTAQVRNASLAYQDLPNSLSELNGTLVFNQDRLEVQSLTGRTGGGEVSLGGFLNIGPRLGLNLTMRDRACACASRPASAACSILICSSTETPTATSSAATCWWRVSELRRSSTWATTLPV
jgi:translocation and assembly module TamB